MKLYLAYKKPVLPIILPILWMLPHRLRRALFALVSPKRFAHTQAMRQLPPDHPDSISSFDRHQCLFVHVPKTGGISLQAGLFKTRGLNNHRPVWQYELTYNQHEFETYFKFGFVRNPWDRLVSAFSYVNSNSHYLSKHEREWAKSRLAPYKIFQDFVKGWLNEENVARSLQEQVWHFVPQYAYLCEPLGRLKLDFVGRYENLPADYEHVRQRLGGIGTALPHENQSRKQARPYQEEYDEESRAIVARVYADDIALFGYQF